MTSTSKPADWLSLGDLRLALVSDGALRVDGGSMFGVVPKALWQRLVTPDERNRISLAANCLLVDAPGGLVLVDVGLGRKLSPKMREIFCVSETPTLLSSLGALGVSPADITFVVPTHLHFDHCGWNTTLDSHGRLVPTFPNARYVIQRAEWEDALNPTEVNKASYLKENLTPIADAGLLTLVDGDTAVCAGIRVVATHGHTRGHQIVFVESAGETLVFVGDLMSTSHHVPLPYIAAFDNYPVTTLDRKRTLLTDAAEKGWLIVWPHDLRFGIGRIKLTDDGKFTAVER